VLIYLFETLFTKVLGVTKIKRNCENSIELVAVIEKLYGKGHDRSIIVTQYESSISQLLCYLRDTKGEYPIP